MKMTITTREIALNVIEYSFKHCDSGLPIYAEIFNDTITGNMYGIRKALREGHGPILLERWYTDIEEDAFNGEDIIITVLHGYKPIGTVNEADIFKRV